MKKPTISICIPTFNRADLLDQTLQTIRFQTVKPFEVLIIDNASTDNTQDNVKKYIDSPVRYIRNKKNVGMIENWNIGIRKSRGEYLTFLHSDDLISPRWYENWIRIIMKDRFRFYTSAFAIVDINNRPLYVCHPFNSRRIIRREQVFHDFMTGLSPNLPPTAANIYHRSVFQECGMFDPSYQTEADVVLCHRIFSRYDIYYDEAINFCYRSHPQHGFDKGKTTMLLDTELSRFKNYIRIIREGYTAYCHNDVTKRYFLLVPVFMTLAPVLLYLTVLKIRKVRGYFSVARKMIPGLFGTFTDWIWFFRIEIRFIRRALFDRFISFNDRRQLTWLKQIRIKKLI